MTGFVNVNFKATRVFLMFMKVFFMNNSFSFENGITYEEDIYEKEISPPEKKIN